jgi:uncharacterized protein (TIGR03437 family)
VECDLSAAVSYYHIHSPSVRRSLAVSLSFLLAASLLIAAITVGQGAPNPAAFINAYDRGLFSTLVSPPAAVVQALAGGGGALVQEFPSLANSKVNYALIEPNPDAPVSQSDTLQVYSDIYTFYTTIGAATAGVPTMDTAACPVITAGACDYQLFTKDTALFVYSAPTTASYSVVDPFYTRWNNGGGIGGTLGVATGAQTAVTSISKVAGAEQTFFGGAIFSYPTGSTAPSVYGVVAPVAAAYIGAGGYAAMGFPTSEAFQVDSTGLMRQLFENGRIEWTGTNSPNVLFPVGEVDITYASQGLTLAPGATATLSATTLDNRGIVVTGRVLTWATTNGAVATVAGNGYTAVVTGVGAGSANVYATSEGKTSASLIVTVGSSVCCAVGQGAPTTAITQAFQTAIARNMVSVVLPAAAPVTRAGNGYVQTFTAAGGSGIVYAVAQADGSGTAWLLTGSIYAAYLANGGFTGTLGYPASDPLAGGLQQFASGAILAGSPVHVIPTAIAVRWLALGGSAAGAGPPTGDPIAFSSYSGSKGVSQTFANGAIFGITSGAVSGKNLSGQAYFSNGLILARYLALSGPTGALGIPISDTYKNGTELVENFEGGYITLQPGATAAVEFFNPASPALTATPAAVVPGGTVHISATGFGPNATLGFTITGQPAFSVKAAAGAFQWDVIVAASAKPGVVLVQATAQGTPNTASGSYTVVNAAALLPSLSILSGNLQTGLPGSSLASPIVVALRDSSGNPIAGAAVSTTASPGATGSTAGATDQNGMIAVTFRLPPSAGVAVGSVAAGGLAVNFSALSIAGSVQNFPTFAVSGQQTSFTVASAALLAYLQNRGSLAAPNGAATPASLTAFLAANNGIVLSEAGDSIPNPWIAARFANTGVTLETTTTDHLRDLLNAGSPVVVNLNLAVDGAPSADASVAAVGVNGDGSIAIVDPNPSFARTSLTDYLSGFSLNGHIVSGKLASIVRFAAVQASTGAAPFTVASQLSAGEATASPAGACLSVDIVGSAATAGARFQYCDGSQSAYEADFVLAKGASLLDLSGSSLGAPVPIAANASLSWTILRTNGLLSVKPASLTVSAVTDAAAFAPALSPGDLISIFGSGFAGTPAVTLAGNTLQVLAVFPFQINAAIPATAVPGNAMLQVTGPDGSATSTVTLSATSPGIFQLGSLGAILNADATLNTPTNPAQRGQFVSVYCTGLGVTVFNSGLQTAAVTPALIVNGVTVQSLFAGLDAGFVGLYQINVIIPPNLPPSLTGTIAIQQGSQTSNTVPIAIQ